MNVISLGESITDTKTTPHEVRSVSEFRMFLSAHTSAKKGGRYIALCPFRDGYRDEKHAMPLGFGGFDFDKETPESAAKLLDVIGKSGYAAVVHETHSHTPERPKLRVFVEFDRKIDPSKYESTLKEIVGGWSKAAEIEFQPDTNCFHASRAYFTPPKSAHIRYFKGSRYRPIGATAEKPKAAEKPKIPTEYEDGSRTPILMGLGSVLYDSGADAKFIRNVLTQFNERQDNPRPSKKVREIAEWWAKKAFERSPKPDSAPIILRTAAELTTNPVRANWLHKPILEQDVTALMVGDYNTYKSFLALDWSLRLASGTAWHGDTRIGRPSMACVYISAEGRGLSKRVRAWIRHHFQGDSVDDVLKRMQFYAIEAAVNLSDPDRISALCSAIDELGITPVLVVVDTLTKNSSGAEETNSAMDAFLTELNSSLRMRYRCTVLLIHHTGHMNKDRARGPITLIANTDSYFVIERQDLLNVTLTTNRLKDSEVPDPMTLRAQVVELDTTDEDGGAESSLVLIPMGGVRKVVPTGVNQLLVYNALRHAAESDQKVVYTSKELNALARTVINRTRLTDTMNGLKKARWIVEHENGWEFAP